MCFLQICLSYIESFLVFAEDIRLYFGESVALYFIFLGFYTTALIPPTILGFVAMLIPQTTTVFFCFFNVLWVTLFLEIWKRKSSELAFLWGTIGMTSLDEPRCEHRGVMGLDEATGRYQAQYPRWKTNLKVMKQSRDPWKVIFPLREFLK